MVGTIEKNNPAHAQKHDLIVDIFILIEIIGSIDDVSLPICFMSQSRTHILQQIILNDQH